MFRPNLPCRIQKSSGRSDVYGQPIPGMAVNEMCSVARLSIMNEKSAVRADTSASRGNALEIEVISIILLRPTTQARIDDIITVSRIMLRISGIQPRYDVNGVLNHNEIHATFWKKQ